MPFAGHGCILVSSHLDPIWVNEDLAAPFPSAHASPEAYEADTLETGFALQQPARVRLLQPRRLVVCFGSLLQLRQYFALSFSTERRVRQLVGLQLTSSTLVC